MLYDTANKAALLASLEDLKSRLENTTPTDQLEQQVVEITAERDHLATKVSNARTAVANATAALALASDALQPEA